MMKILLLFILLLRTSVNEALVRNLSGLYDFENCSCTVLRCLPSNFYRINQTENGDLTIYYYSYILAARGQTISINNGRDTQVSVTWLPGMDFDTSCTGLWIPSTRAINFKCGDQYRYCTGQLKCRRDSGSCAKNSSTSFNIHYIKTLWEIITSLSFFLLFIEKINHSFSNLY